MIFKLSALLITLLASSLAIPAIPTPEENELSSFFIHADPTPSRIVGGTVAQDGSAPHMAVLTDGFLIRSLVCGGSVIGPRTVLTAAHCIDAVFFWNLSSFLRVTVGTNRWNTGGVTYLVARNVTHPNWVTQTIKNDVGVLITTTDIATTNLISPAPLTYDFIPGGVPVRVTGWGRIRAGGSLSANLLELHTTTIEGEVCEEEVRLARIRLNFPTAPDSESHIEICTFHSEGHGTCNGDSGSALVRTSDGSQVGIVSWGFPCARAAPDMFVRVSAFQDFITSNTV